MATMTVSKVRELSRKLEEEIRQLSMQEVIQKTRKARPLFNTRQGDCKLAGPGLWCAAGC